MVRFPERETLFSLLLSSDADFSWNDVVRELRLALTPDSAEIRNGRAFTVPSNNRITIYIFTRNLIRYLKNKLCE